MTQPRSTRKPAASRKGAAASAEKSDEPRTIDFRGLTLTVPKPADWSAELYFAMGDLESGKTKIAGANGVLAAMLGQDQFDQVRDRLIEQQVKFTDVEEILGELFMAAMEAYGTTSGESSASPES